MLTPKEKRFLKYWQDQKAGGKLPYILLYTTGWALVCFFLPLAVSVFVNVLNFFHFDILPVWLAIVLALLIGFVISQFTWYKNENRERTLLRKQEETTAAKDKNLPG